MSVPVWLWRLLQRPKLSSHVKLGPEDQLALEIADQCRIWSMEGRLMAMWWHTANEAGGGSDTRHRQIQMAKARALGMIAGTADLVFIGNQRERLFEGAHWRHCHDVLLIELKAKRGSQSENQADFAAWSAHHQIPYLICRSLAEVEEALIKHGLLQLEPPRR